MATKNINDNPNMSFGHLSGSVLDYWINEFTNAKDIYLWKQDIFRKIDDEYLPYISHLMNVQSRLRENKEEMIKVSNTAIINVENMKILTKMLDYEIKVKFVFLHLAFASCFIYCDLTNAYQSLSKLSPVYRDLLKNAKQWLPKEDLSSLTLREIVQKTATSIKVNTGTKIFSTTAFSTCLEFFEILQKTFDPSLLARQFSSNGDVPEVEFAKRIVQVKNARRLGEKIVTERLNKINIELRRVIAEQYELKNYINGIQPG